MGTVIVGLIILGVVFLIVRKMVHDKKNGKSSCGCNCGSCGGSCGSNIKDQRNNIVIKK
ncbi:FeoB-associated Cys-rich membrane protein [Clostridium sp. BJN0001]|uniref:FeoB-associated Cys-rich membrane protein n=1 Tax=Clostridium sp. BJN0001 TaxID=2930219 RepID=UPI001FD22EDA|nr:FeoB-associated Cys-rich membrane protein [Clostridium sp. BJN0001]